MNFVEAAVSLRYNKALFTFSGYNDCVVHVYSPTARKTLPEIEFYFLCGQPEYSYCFISLWIYEVI